MEEIPKCEDCNEEMVSVGRIGPDVEIYDHKRRITGIRQLELYQCTKCKKVVIN